MFFCKKTLHLPQIKHQKLNINIIDTKLSKGYPIWGIVTPAHQDTFIRNFTGNIDRAVIIWRKEDNLLVKIAAIPVNGYPCILRPIEISKYNDAALYNLISELNCFDEIFFDNKSVTENLPTYRLTLTSDTVNAYLKYHSRYIIKEKDFIKKDA